jgi:hypothetical protein
MKLIKLIIILTLGSCFAHTATVKKEGLVPMYKPCDLGIMLLFVPYNPTMVFVGDCIGDISCSAALVKERANIYSFTADMHDFEKMRDIPNINSNFGVLRDRKQSFALFYSTLDQKVPDELHYRFSGSLLKPLDIEKPVLFGPSYQIPTYNFLNFCQKEQLKKIHILYLDCGGYELSLLKSIEDYVKNGIIVFVKTYHKKIREGIIQFEPMHDFMIKQGYELFSHYIYDDVCGDALYIKSKYVSAVFRTKEL